MNFCKNLSNSCLFRNGRISLGPFLEKSYLIVLLAPASSRPLAGTAYGRAKSSAPSVVSRSVPGLRYRHGSSTSNIVVPQLSDKLSEIHTEAEIAF